MIKPVSILSLLLLLLSGACNLIDQTSPNDIDADIAIRDAAGAESALLGCYSALQQGAYYGGQYLLIGEALADNASTGGYNVLSLDQIGSRACTPANLITEETWISIYRAIANTNYLLRALPAIEDLDAARKKSIEGQARALRAMAHFDLLRYFGEHWDSGSAFGVPLIQSVQTIEDKPTRAAVGETYNFIVSELNAARNLLEAGDDQPQFVHKNTVSALLARVYLYKGDKSAAAAAATELIDNPNFALLPADEYGAIFSRRRSSESIFELAFDNQNRSEYNGLTYSRDDAIRPELNYLASQALDEFFKARTGDVRATLVDFDPANNDVTITPDGRTQKYRGEDSRDNPAYILRLAEMYLIRAEAKGRREGLADLNTIRTQRGLTALSDADLADDAAFLSAVLDERRAEFNFEGHRYFDLARTRKYAEATGTDAFRGILPIPGREIIASGGLFKQNPGY